MDDKFLYVFSLYERDKLLSLGYELFQSDEQNGIFVFLNQDVLRFDLSDIRAVSSNILTF